jgi:hypothetical protein
MAIGKLDPELDRRITALEQHMGEGADFDGASWFWLLALGVMLPVVVLIVGWQS